MKRAFAPQVLAATIALLAAGNAAATNGYFTHGIGTHNKSQAGAGTAAPTQSIDAANNPASGVLVDDAWNLGVAAFSPRRDYAVTPSQLNGQFGAFSLGAGKTESDSEWFFIPYVAKNWKLDERSALTASFYGRGGMNTTYSGGSASLDPDGPGPAPVTTFPGTYGAGDTGVDLSQAFLELAYSRQYGDWSLGVAPVVVGQMFKIKGVGNFAPFTKTFAASGGTVFPDGLTNNDYDTSFGIGLKLGAIWQATDRLSLALAYHTETDMGEFDDYSDLFAQEGDFDIPATWRAGVSWGATETLKLHFDAELTEYGNVDAIANPLAGVFQCPTAGVGGTDVEACGGGERGFGFGWDDVTVYRVGATWTPQHLRATRISAGYSWTEQPIQPEDALVNILAPAVMEEHYTFGFGVRRDNGHEVSVALMYAPRNSVGGANAFDPTQNITLTMEQFEIEFGYNF